MDAKQAGLKRLAPILTRADPVSISAWMLSVIPFLVVPPALAILLVVFAGKPDQEQRRRLYAVAAINICLSLYLWSWVGDHFIAIRESIADWLWSVGSPNTSPGAIRI
ncbi:hypothetical protein RFM68_09625 [Mesorhizobium sp. MSK_1335]|uniref:Uncharacterized protein n=1 Tax=Mesorhizobium montanum TaxID=3072323 RepID=A0ABU4ZHB9_9HYPH|nr:hypothetical protein [Mesorhizobium sp. MSK_1335]MDX8524768.1 hypothetical protein [Mesorhizobium sp. MSK_1335]